MSSIITFLLGFALFVIIVLAIVFHKSLKNFKKVLQQVADAREARRVAEEEAYFKRTSTKHYREKEKPKFKEDYFKGTGDKQAPDPRQQHSGQAQQPRSGQNQQQKTKQETTTRRTVDADSGVTIIDDRKIKPTDRKIFNDNEGEYVDFEEVKD